MGWLVCGGCRCSLLFGTDKDLDGVGVSAEWSWLCSIHRIILDAESGLRVWKFG